MSTAFADGSPSWVAVIVACGGVGALIDFALGKAGQLRVKSALETLWIRISYTKFRTFGREEMLASARILRAAFGEFISWRRLLAIAFLALTCFAVWLFLPEALVLSNIEGFSVESSVASLVLHILVFTLSISLTIWFCEATAQHLSERAAVNLLFFFTALLVQYLALVVLHVTLESFLDVVSTIFGGDAPAYGDLIISSAQASAEALKRDLQRAFDPHFNLQPYLWSFLYTPDKAWTGYVSFFLNVLSYGPQVLRVLLAVVFAASCLLKPLSRLVLLLLQRLVENDKPTFTLLAGGLGAIAKATQDLVGRL
jgi:hypothetical protein